MGEAGWLSLPPRPTSSSLEVLGLQCVWCRQVCRKLESLL